MLLGRLFGSSADAAADLLQGWIHAGAPFWIDADGLLVLTPPAPEVARKHCQALLLECLGNFAGKIEKSLFGIGKLWNICYEREAQCQKYQIKRQHNTVSAVILLRDAMPCRLNCTFASFRH